MILLNEDDISVRCLNIPENQLPIPLLILLEDSEPYTYMDTADIAEHMYTVEEVKECIERRNLEEQYREIMSEIEKLCDEYGCAYWRVTKW